MFIYHFGVEFNETKIPRNHVILSLETTSKLGEVICMLPASYVNTERFQAFCTPRNVIK